MTQPPEELRVFAQRLCLNSNGLIIVTSDRILQSAIKIRWQDITNTHSGLIATDERIGKLVRDLFIGFKEQEESIIEHWSSYLSGMAIEVAEKNHRRLGLPLRDVQNACVNAIIDNRLDFYKSYKDSDGDRELLSSLRNYSRRTIKNLSYPYLRLQFSDVTIGRTNLGLITKFGSIRKSLKYCGANDQTIDRDVRLCKILKEYLRRENITINKIKPSHEFSSFCQLYRNNYPEYNDLPVNITSKQVDIYDRLDKIGAAIRKFKQRVGIGNISTDQPLKPEDESSNIGSTLVSTTLPPGRSEEDLQMQNIIREGISSCYCSLSPRDKKILYLFHIFNLKQERIGHIVMLDQAGVSRDLVTIHKRMKETLIDEIRENNQIGDRDAIEMILETLSSGSKLEIRHSNNIDYQERLILLIEQYNRYFEYLGILRKEYRKLAQILKEVKKQEGYAQQFEYLSTLSREQYPGLKPDLNSLSFVILIEQIQSILQEKIQNSSNELWS